jgi:GT2 family glycosyltransferase
MLTNGSLPVAPFRHLEPTAVGVIDLERRSVSLLGADGPGHRDALLLVRRGAAPLGVVHVERAQAATDVEEVLALADQQLGGRPVGAWLPPAPEDLGSVAVIIPTGGRARALARCLDSLAPNVPEDAEIIVVDNRPRGGETREVVERWHPRASYLAEERPGSSVARNRGLAATGAELVAFTDDDVVVDDGWLSWLLAPFQDPRVNVTTGLVLPLELATAAQKRFELYAGFGKGINRRSYDLDRDRADDRLLYPFWGGVFGSGNSMAFRRTDLVEAGGFDPALGAGSVALAGADIEAMSAAVLRGGRLVYEPRSICWHEHRRDDASLRRQLFNYGVGFTAILTKGAINDRRFAGALARSVPVALRLRRRRSTEPVPGRDAAPPPELARLQRKGMLKGPSLYAKSVRWAKRLRLDQVVQGG